jgi:uncharacterized protein YrrD
LEVAVLRRVDALTRLSVRATDGAIGRVTDAYFDDQKWAVRYLVVDTGLWLGWHVLISPHAIGTIDWDGSLINVALTREQVEHGPRADLQHPLSRLYETEFYTHFGYPPYWDAPPTWGVGPEIPESQRPETSAPVQSRAAEAIPGAPLVASAADSHVRSWREVKGYHIHAEDGEIGHVDDLLVDEKSWLIRFIEVDTSNWIGGTSVLVPRTALGPVNWPDSTLSVRLVREQVKHSPRADEAHLTGVLEQELEEYYGGRKA